MRRSLRYGFSASGVEDMWRNQAGADVAQSKLCWCEIKEVGKRGGFVAGAWVSEFVEERVAQSGIGRETLSWLVNEELANEIDCVGGCCQAEDLRPEMRLNFRKVKVRERPIHGLDLLASRCAQHLDDLDELIDARFAWKEGLSEQ